MRGKWWVFGVLIAPLWGVEDLPLGEVAAASVSRLPAGGIVAGERTASGKVRFSVAGDPGVAGVAPERVVFEVGSISKVFTGILLAIAVEEGKLGYGTTLGELLELEFADPKVARITMLQLITHTSGLPRLPDNIGPQPDLAPDPYADYDRKKLEAYLKGAELVGEGPYPVAYSNLGVGLLGDLLARRYGLSWEQLVIAKIAGPLGMKDTRVDFGAGDSARIAPPWHGEDAAVPWHFDALAGAGALRSTAADLMILGEALRHPQGTPLAGALREVVTARAEAPAMGMKVGLGIFLGRVDGGIEYLHSGGTGGFRAVLQVLPTRGVVRVVLVNNDALPAEGLLVAVRRDSGADGPVLQLGDEALRGYAGVYELGPGARFTFVVHRGQLRARLTGQPFVPLEALGDDRFRCEGVAAEYRFEREDGKLAAVTLHQHGREIRAGLRERMVPAIVFPDERELADFAGEYALSGKLTFTLSVSEGTLFARLTGQPALPVFATGADRFEYDVVEAALEFERDEAGRVVALILHQNGRHRAPRR